MKVRLLKPEGFRKVGRIMDVADGVGQTWIDRKVATRVAEGIETMVPPREMNVQIGGKRRRTA